MLHPTHHDAGRRRSFVSQATRLLLVALVVTSSRLQAQTEDVPAPRQDPPGLPVGAKAANFELPAADGRTHDLAALLNGRKAVALVFHRSADW